MIKWTFELKPLVWKHYKGCLRKLCDEINISLRRIHDTIRLSDESKEKKHFITSNFKSVVDILKWNNKFDDGHFERRSTKLLRTDHSHHYPQIVDKEYRNIYTQIGVETFLMAQIKTFRTIIIIVVEITVKILTPTAIIIAQTVISFTIIIDLLIIYVLANAFCPCRTHGGSKFSLSGLLIGLIVIQGKAYTFLVYTGH